MAALGGQTDLAPAFQACRGTVRSCRCQQSIARGPRVITKERSGLHCTPCFVSTLSRDAFTCVVHALYKHSGLAKAALFSLLYWGNRGTERARFPKAITGILVMSCIGFRFSLARGAVSLFRAKLACNKQLPNRLLRWHIIKYY